MKNVIFRNTINPEDITQVMKVVKTFGANDENLVKIQNYIAKELQELGDNRNLYLLEDEARVIGMVQLILKKADGDPELANGRDVAHVRNLYNQLNYVLLKEVEGRVPEVRLFYLQKVLD